MAKSTYPRIGQLVMVASDSREHYAEFAGRKLKVIDKATSTKDTPYYDSSMNGMPLYCLKDVATGQLINSSLYAYELTEWEEPRKR